MAHKLSKGQIFSWLFCASAAETNTLQRAARFPYIPSYLIYIMHTTLQKFVVLLPKLWAWGGKHLEICIVSLHVYKINKVEVVEEFVRHN